MLAQVEETVAPTHRRGLRNPIDPSARIRAVLFDVDGTLYRQLPVRALMALELLTMPLSGIGRASRRWRALRMYRIAQERLRRSGAGGAVASAQLTAAADAAGLPQADVEALVNEWMLTRPLKYLRLCRAAGITPLLRLLERAGVRAGVLSDYPTESKLRALGLAGRFSPIVCATDPDVDAFKPSPRSFLRACELWGLPPRDVLMIGDRADVDAAGAIAAGMPCVIVGRTSSRHVSTGYRVFSSLKGLHRALEHD